MAKSTLQRLVDSGLQVSEMSRQQAESVVRQLVKAGEVQRRDAENLVQKLLEMGRETTFRLAEQVEAELVRQVRQLSTRLDDVEDRLESLSRQVRERDSGSPAGEHTPAKSVKKDEKAKPKKGDGKKKADSGTNLSKKKSDDSKTKEGPKGSADAAPGRSAAPAVGASGVRRIPTTRAARDAD